MKNILLIFILYFQAIAGTAERPPVNQKGNYSTYISILNRSSEQTFYEILESYQSFIADHPDDITARVEECRFLQLVIDDEIIAYDTAYAIFNSSKQELFEKFPDRYEVVLFRSTVIETDSAIALLEEHLKNNPQIESDKSCWEYFDQLARLYSAQEEPYNSIHYGVIAERLNDTLDISLLLAQQCDKAGDKKTAIAYLKKFKERQRTYFEYLERGELLFNLKEYEYAAEMLSKAVDLDGSDYVRLKLTQSLIEQGKYKQARKSLAAMEKSGYYDEAILRTMFDLDIRYGSKDSALQSYTLLRDKGFHTDPLAKKRLSLFFSYPSAPWQLRDIGGVAALLLIFLICFLLPALWILPVHYAGLLRKVQPPEYSRWNLKHFWIASAIMLVSGAIAGIFFGYNDILQTFNSNDRMGMETSDRDYAWLILAHMSFISIGCSFLIRNDDFQNFWGPKWSKLKSIGSGIGWLIIIRIALAILFALIMLLFNPDILQQQKYNFFKPLSFDLTEKLLAVKDTFGWGVLMLFAGIIAPLYEEFIFRGIGLRSMQRYLPFAWSNFLQALIFALLHLNLLAMVNAFFLGLTAGILRNRSSSLAPGIALHIGNNILAVLMMMVSSYLSKGMS